MTQDPQHLIMIEPEIKRPSFRADSPEDKRMYKWIHLGEELRINETRLRERLKSVKLVCTVDILIMRLYNTHSLVINTNTGEVFDGSAVAA